MRGLRGAVLEAISIAVAGCFLAVLANAVSPRGLKLTRDYFPRSAVTHASVASTNAAATSSPLVASLQKLGLTVAGSNDVVQLFRDPAYEQGLIVFVDARNDEAFAKGHIPGAWQLDRYRPENYLPTVLPLCLSAQKVLVYCNGGSCEDSEFAAVMLRDAGVPAQNLMVYLGGIAEWTNGMPFEVGVRGSGQIVEPKQ